MKKQKHIALAATLMLLNTLTHSLSSKDINVDSVFQKKTIPTSSISEMNLPIQPYRIPISGIEINPEMTALTIGMEFPITKSTSITTNFGLGIEGEYDYIDASPALSNSQMNFQLNSELKLYFKELNNKSNWFFTIGVYYSHAGYEGTHTVSKNYIYSPGGWFIIPLPGGWYAQDNHQNNFQIESSNIGMELILGYQKVLLKRMPLEIKTGFVIRQNNLRVTNYESSDPDPNYSYDELDNNPEHSVMLPLISFKIGYMLFNK